MADWTELLARDTLYDKARIVSGIGRTEFQKDHDKVIFSEYFRRLNRKTQVHPLSANDHIHNRMIHSLEVSCVGRSLGYMVGEQIQLPMGYTSGDIATIVEAACLAHDLGNPPFGHAGEDAIRDWFRTNRARLQKLDLTADELLDLESFEGNAQGFRILAAYERIYGRVGLKITLGTLAAFQKYPWTVHRIGDNVFGKRKFGSYLSEQDLLDKLFRSIGGHQLGDHYWARHPLVFLTEAADDICYAILDLEDGVEMGLIKVEELEEILLPLLNSYDLAGYAEIRETHTTYNRISYMRARVIDVVISDVSRAFLSNERFLKSGTFHQEIFHACDPAVDKCIGTAKELARSRIFRNHSKTALEIGAFSNLSIILDKFCDAAVEWFAEGRRDEALSFKSRRIFDLMGAFRPRVEDSSYITFRRIIDYVSGMTDSYSIRLAKLFSGLGE